MRFPQRSVSSVVEPGFTPGEMLKKAHAKRGRQ
jgi:hypothetical protein